MTLHFPSWSFAPAPAHAHAFSFEPAYLCNMNLIGPLSLLLLAATSAFASGDSDDDPSQRIISDLPSERPAPPPFWIVTCPPSCPCCPWCDPRGGCGSLWKPVSFVNVRALAGCESLAGDTPLCPVGKCSPYCLCRETFVTQLKDLLINEHSQQDEDGAGLRLSEEQKQMLLEEQKNQAGQQQSNEARIAAIARPPPVDGVTITCPPSCRCCDWCDHRSSDCPNFKADSYLAVRLAVGCESLPATTPLCPVGKCRGDCLCREVLLDQLDNILFKGAEKTDEE